MRENTQERSTGIDIDLQELLMFYLHKWWVIVLCTVVAATIVLGSTYLFVTPTYKANVSIYVNNNRDKAEDGYVSYNDLSVSLRLVNTYINIVTSNRVLEKVSEALHNEYSVGQLAGCVTASQLNNTEIFCVYVTHPNPEEAARIANAVAQVAPDEIAAVIEGSSARIIDMANVPTTKASPNYTTMTLLGAVGGVLIAIVFLTVCQLSDIRIKDEEDLSALFDMPILGRIPDFAQLEESDAAMNVYATTNGRTAK